MISLLKIYADFDGFEKTIQEKKKSLVNIWNKKSLFNCQTNKKELKYS